MTFHWMSTHQILINDMHRSREESARGWTHGALAFSDDALRSVWFYDGYACNWNRNGVLWRQGSSLFHYYHCRSKGNERNDCQECECLLYQYFLYCGIYYTRATSISSSVSKCVFLGLQCAQTSWNVWQVFGPSSHWWSCSTFPPRAYDIRSNESIPWSSFALNTSAVLRDCEEGTRQMNFWERRYSS